MPGRVPLSVSVRIRPVPEKEQGLLQQTSPSKDASNGIIETRGKLVELMDAEKQHLSKFTVDNVFPASCTSSDVFSTIGEPLLQHVLSGYNACCFAYGQTGSGKTYNMLGSSTAADHKGLIPQCVERIFSAMKETERSGSKSSVFISFIEIYQEHVRDLGKAVSRLQEAEGLKRATSAGSRPSSGRPPRPPSAATRRILEDLAQESLDVVVDADGNTSVRGLTYIEVNSAAEAATLLAGESSVAGCLHMVDLAGSEDMRRNGSGSEEQRLAEARSINSSLSTLGKVVMLLSSEASSGVTASHIPFRDSKLTRILKDSLSGNCLTHLLACVYPTARNCRECLSTLQFALRCAEIKTSPVVNTISQSSSKCSCSSNELVAELTKQVSELQREVDDTHSHYQKLLEGAKPKEVDFGPIERAGDSAVHDLAASTGVEGAEAAGQLQPGTPKERGGSDNSNHHQADGVETSQAGQQPASFEKRGEKAKVKRVGMAVAQEQALLDQIRSLESQLERATWKWNDASTQLRTLREDHAKLLRHTSKQSGKAAESQRTNAATIRKLNDDLQQASDDRRTEITSLTKTAAEEHNRLREQLDTLTRHNTQLIRSIPEMFSKQQADSDKAVRKSEAKETELREWFEATITEMESSVARRVEFAEAATEKAKKQGDSRAQDLQHQLAIATERWQSTEKEWQKEAKVLWRYCDRLAALVDLMASGGIMKPAKPPPSTLPRKSDFVRPLTSIISAATSKGSSATIAVETCTRDQDPGRMSAASLKRTLQAVSAVESYLANSGRLDLQDSNECEGDENTTSGENKLVAPPGWKLALEKVNAELKICRQECSTLQQENSRLQEELVDCLPERNERKKALKQEEQDAARATNLQKEVSHYRDLLKKEQEAHLGARTALESAHRRLSARQSDSHHVPAHRPQSALRPCSAPLSCPANMHQYPTAMSAVDKPSGTSQYSQGPLMTTNAPTIRSKYGLSSYRPGSSLRHSSRTHSGTSSKNSPSHGCLNGSCSVTPAWPSSESSTLQQSGSPDPLYNRHACTIVEDLVSTSQATIQAHKAQLRAESARPYVRNAQAI